MNARAALRLKRPIGLIAAAAGAIALTVGLAAGATAAPPSTLPQGGEPVVLNPADFSTEITNPYFPLVPGTRFIYREQDAEGTVQKGVTHVTSRTKLIANGITARVVHDVVSEHGAPVEKTFDWYAQDSAGNVWYLGEDTKEYDESGNVSSTHGSFEAGVDGAQPGVIMPASLQVGLTYRQEYYAGQAEDTAEILSLDEQAGVPFGHFNDVLMTKEINPLEPRHGEYKFYARGIGPVLELTASGGTDRVGLLKVTHAR
jgi:hypothetical protein